MRIQFSQRYSPAKGRVVPAGYVDDVPDEVAVDLIQRGFAAPAQPVMARAVAEPVEKRTLTPALSQGAREVTLTPALSQGERELGS